MSEMNESEGPVILPRVDRRMVTDVSVGLVAVFCRAVQ